MTKNVKSLVKAKIEVEGIRNIILNTLPQNITNGDVIKIMFPDIEFTDMAFTVHAAAKVTSNGVNGGISYDFWKDWWNALYKK